MAVGTVCCEPVYTLISLLIWENTGNILIYQLIMSIPHSGNIEGASSSYYKHKSFEIINRELSGNYTQFSRKRIITGKPLTGITVGLYSKLNFINHLERTRTHGNIQQNTSSALFKHQFWLLLLLLYPGPGNDEYFQVTPPFISN